MSDTLSLEFKSALNSLLQAKQLVIDNKLDKNSYLDRSNVFIELFSNSSIVDEQLIVLSEKESQELFKSTNKEKQSMKKYDLKEGKHGNWSLELDKVSNKYRHDLIISHHTKDYLVWLDYVSGKFKISFYDMLYQTELDEIQGSNGRIKYSVLLPDEFHEICEKIFNDLKVGEKVVVKVNNEINLIIHRTEQRSGIDLQYKNQIFMKNGFIGYSKGLLRRYFSVELNDRYGSLNEKLLLDIIHLFKK